MFVIPNICGFCVWSPVLDATGVSSAGMAFCYFSSYIRSTILNKRSNSLTHRNVTPLPHTRKRAWKGSKTDICSFFGELLSLEHLISLGGARIVNMGDYDSRTALHLAASEGHKDAVKRLLQTRGCCPDPIDRWGRSPLDDAVAAGHHEIAKCCAGSRDEERWKDAARASCAESPKVGRIQEIPS